MEPTYITELLRKLVKINSVNPSLEPSGRGEAEISRFIAAELESMGIQAWIDEIEPGRMNVTGIIPGSGGGKSLILNAHTDTVGISGMNDPFSGRIENGKLYGRGAYDMKGSIAAILAAGRNIIREKKQMRGDVILSFVADEEYESMGAFHFVSKYRADAAIVTEPTDLRICLAHRGFGIFEIITEGKTAHGGNHRLGVDANMKMGLLLAELNQYAARLPDQKKHPLCGEASVHVPLIQGGNSLFIYANECKIHLERRTIPGETQAMITGELASIIKKLEVADPGFRAVLRSLLWRDPYEIDRNRPVVQQLVTAAEKVLASPAEFTGHTWWEDSAVFGKSGIESVIIGPKGGGIHEETEWVEIESVVRLAEILQDTVVTFCNS